MYVFSHLFEYILFQYMLTKYPLHALHNLIQVKSLSESINIDSWVTMRLMLWVTFHTIIVLDLDRTPP